MAALPETEQRRRRAWEDARGKLLEATADLMPPGRERVRLADLLTAHALARSAGLVGPLDTASSVPRQLEATVALAPVRGASRARRPWREATEAALALAELTTEGDLVHEWSVSSQASDPGRKGRGAYSTPPPLATVMAEHAVGAGEGVPTVLDPSAGHGSLLVATFQALRDRGVPAPAALAALHGVELDPHARELCCLTVWLAAADRGCRLEDVAGRIVLGNAICAGWQSSPATRGGPSSHAGFTWESAFPAAFERGGFDVVVANPPWESLRHRIPAAEERWMERDETHARLSRPVETGRGLPPLYSAQGRGDRNLFKAFVELFPHLLADGGRLAALLPGAFSSDLGLKPARDLYLEHMAIDQWTGFENLAKHFPIDSRYKFGILFARRSDAGTRRMRVRFLARDADDARGGRGHVRLTRARLATLGGPSSMFPEVNDDAELEVLTRAMSNGTPFFDPHGVFGSISYRREVDLTLDRKAGNFIHVSQASARGFEQCPDGSWSDGETSLVPLIEGRMVGPYDFFQKSWRGGSGRSARWTVNGEASLRSCSSQFVAPPVDSTATRLAICDITSATNTRTMLATWVPDWPCGNTAPVLAVEDDGRAMALLAVLCTMTFDWVLRRIASGLHLNRFYLESTPLPALSPDEVASLAGFAVAKLRASPRYRELDGRAGAHGDRVSALHKPIDAAAAEMIVARGYGLGAAELARVLSPDRSDRKGLWRYFATEPSSAKIAEDTLERLRAA